MKQTVNLYQFREGFHRVGAAQHFTYAGSEILFNYLTEMEDSCGEEMEFDVIALCCDYAESTPKEMCEEYELDVDPDDIEDVDDPEDEAYMDAARAYLDERGAFVGQTDIGTIVYFQL